MLAPRIQLVGLAVLWGLGLIGGMAGVSGQTPPLQEVRGKAIRIVACDQQVVSHKRGVCANQMSKEDFAAFAPGVSWWYTWHYEPTDLPGPGVKMEFLPMAWGDRPADLAGLEKYLAAGHKPRAVLTLNEPNLKDQAFIPPEQTAKFYTKVKAIADKYQIPVIGPHMALGSAKEASITAYDPIEKKPVTYTYMVPFLKSVLFYLGQTEVPATAFHTYGDIHELRWATEMMFKEFNRPVWVTEYAQWNAKTPEAARTYLIQATDFLERNPHVQGYAWFKERANDNDKISLLKPESGKLSPLGEAYVRMPVHEAEVYYRLPGKLPAENYVTMERMEVYPTSDTEGFLDVTAEEEKAAIVYHVQVDQAGGYEVTLRVKGAGSLKLIAGDKVLGTGLARESGWQDVIVKVQLGAGAQTIGVKGLNQGQSLNWLEFRTVK